MSEIKKTDRHQLMIGADYVMFTAKCMKCGSPARITNSLAMGSEYTGMYGSIDIECTNKTCGNVGFICE